MKKSNEDESNKCTTQEKYLGVDLVVEVMIDSVIIMSNL